MTTVGKAALGVALATLSAAGYGGIAASPVRADPVMHQVRYVITAQSPIWADIYYLDSQPAKFSDYSHNTYQFTPNVQATLDEQDLDLGSGGLLILPTQTAGNYPHLAVQAGKQGTFYLLNRDNLGGYNTSAVAIANFTLQ